MGRIKDGVGWAKTIKKDVFFHNTVTMETSAIGWSMQFITYRIMYKLAVCSNGMTEAKPRLFRQNRPASEYIV